MKKKIYRSGAVIFDKNWKFLSKITTPLQKSPFHTPFFFVEKKQCVVSHTNLLCTPKKL